MLFHSFIHSTNYIQFHVIFYVQCTDQSERCSSLAPSPPLYRSALACYNHNKINVKLEGNADECIKNWKKRKKMKTFRNRVLGPCISCMFNYFKFQLRNASRRHSVTKRVYLCIYMEYPIVIVVSWRKVLLLNSSIDIVLFSLWKLLQCLGCRIQFGLV